MKTMLRLSALASVAASALAAALPAQAQNVEEGRKKAAMCIGCHGITGYQASFPEVYKVPMISGQSQAYIAAALNAYRKGDRKHPTMRGIAVSMTDADIADVAAFYARGGSRSPVKPVADTPARQPSAEVAALLNKGACASCHGANYNKPIDGTYPKIAGQHADYLFAALRAYGTEGRGTHGRNNAIMAGQVKNFRRDELKAMANYLASLPGDLHVDDQPPFRGTVSRAAP